MDSVKGKAKPCPRFRASSARDRNRLACAHDPAFTALRRSELIGRPLGDNALQGAISRRLGRAVAPGKRGRKPKAEERRTGADRSKKVKTGVLP